MKAKQIDTKHDWWQKVTRRNMVKIMMPLYFAPVAKQTTFRTLLTISTAENIKARHFEIKTAFFNGDITEDLYMSQPESYIADGEQHLVIKLQTSLYGLKQSAGAWNAKMNDVMLKHGFVRSKADQCLYSKCENNKWMYVLLYVDDLIVDDEDMKPSGCSGTPSVNTSQ